MEEIKNNEFDKQNKEKDYYKTYLNSLQKRPTSFRPEYFSKTNDFTPYIYKHPENIYLKAISEYLHTKEKMKKYNKKTGQFDLYLNRTRTNKFYIDADNKNNNIIDNNNINNINALKNSHSNLNSNSKNKNKNYIIKKKKIFININRGNSTKNYYHPSTKSSCNTFLTTNQKRTNTTKKTYSQNNSNKKLPADDKGEITVDEMINFLLEKEKENGKTNQKKMNISNPINYKKNSEQKKKIITSLNDPLNPYSALFYNNILYNNYKVKMHYKKMEQGVPYLRIKKLKKTDLPPLTQGSNYIEDNLLGNTYSPVFNLNKPKKIIILPSDAKENNRSTSRKKNNESKDNKNNDKKDIETKVLFQSYGENSDFVNKDYEFKKEKEEKNEIKNDKKKLSGIIEEDN